MHSIFAMASGHHVWFTELLRRYGYLALFGIIAAQDIGVPTLVPGTLLLIFAGYLSSTHTLNPVICGLVATAGSVSGATVLFQIARLGGDTFVRRFGRFIQLDKEHRAELEQTLWRWGVPAWVVIRLIPGFRDVLTIVAGIGGMSYRRFALLTTAATLIWAYACVFVGMLLGRHWFRAGGAVAVSGRIAAVVLVVVVVFMLLAARGVRARRTWLMDQRMALVVMGWRRDVAARIPIARSLQAANRHILGWRRDLAARLPMSCVLQTANRQMLEWCRDLAVRLRLSHRARVANRHLLAEQRDLADRTQLARERGRRLSDEGTDPRR
jgi:membrane protein DedA with SNARE-associated domain